MMQRYRDILRQLQIDTVIVLSKITQRLSHYRKLHSSRAIVRRMEVNSRDIAIELGSGEKIGSNNWVTIDQITDCDVYWDLRLGIPFGDNTVAKIYSSHFFEHLTFKEIEQMLDECLRVLKTNGEFLISVPNARLYIESYSNNDDMSGKGFFGHWPAYNNTTRIDYINYIAYMDGHHKYMFDEENLLYILNNKGFREVQLRGFDAELDPAWRDFESIYARAIK